MMTEYTNYSFNTSIPTGKITLKKVYNKKNKWDGYWIEVSGVLELLYYNPFCFHINYVKSM